MSIRPVRREDGYHCWYCNALIDDVAAECPECGHALDVAEETASAEAEKSGSNAAPDPPLQSWSVKCSTAIGGFVVAPKGTMLQLRGAGTFTARPPTQMGLAARWDPPGNWWRALYATIGTVAVAVLVTKATGFFVGPGGLGWYLIIRAIRRRHVSIDLSRPDAVIIDPKTRRAAFLAEFNGKKWWIAFEFTERFEEAYRFIRTAVADKCQDDRVRLDRLGELIALLALIALLIVVAVIISTR